MGMTGEQAYVLAKKLIEAGGGGGGTVDAYTKTQTDNLLIKKADKSDLNNLKGDLIQTNVELNTFFGNELMWNDGAYISRVGIITEQADYSYSNLIPVLPNDKVRIKAYFSGYSGYAFFGKNKEYISMGARNETGETLFDELIDVPYNSYYLVISSITNEKSKAFVSVPIMPLLQSEQEKRICDDITSMSIYETFAVVGDSYGAGQIVLNGSLIDKKYYSWGNNIARMCGNTCNCYSRGGQSTRSFLIDEGPSGNNQMLYDTPSQLYFLCLGINDALIIKNGENDYLGSKADFNSNYEDNPDTFYGNYAKIIGRIKSHSPKAKIIMCTIGLPNENNIFGIDVDSINTAIVAIAKNYGIPILTLNDDSFFNSEFYLKNMYYGHPTTILYGGYAKAIMRLYNKCVFENYEYFKDFTGLIE